MGKYEEALERAKSFVKRGGEYDRQVMESIFPELKESEDERIRKEIINFFRSPFVTENITDEKIAPWIAYLEKQKDEVQRQFNLGVRAGREEVLYEMEKEQKTIQSKNEKEYVRILKSIIADFIRDKKPEDVSFYQQIYDWLDGRHIEQKPAEGTALQKAFIGSKIDYTLEEKCDACPDTFVDDWDGCADNAIDTMLSKTYGTEDVRFDEFTEAYDGSCEKYKSLCDYLENNK